MMDSIANIFRENWSSLPEAPRNAASADALSVTKFHHGRSTSRSKVLFLITSRGSAIALAKIARSAAGNEKLRQEKAMQERFAGEGLLGAPKVFFEASFAGLFLYAEEIIEGTPLSALEALRRESEIVGTVSKWQEEGTMPSARITEILTSAAPASDDEVAALLAELRSRSIDLKKGTSHGDMTRKNILASGETLRLIDWDRALERPFAGIDGVHYVVRTRGVKDFEEWKKSGRAAFMGATNADEATADALYLVEAALELLLKRYPKRYIHVIQEFGSL